jgi:hypothetical protein
MSASMSGLLESGHDRAHALAGQEDHHGAAEQAQIYGSVCVVSMERTIE